MRTLFLTKFMNYAQDFEELHGFQSNSELSHHDDILNLDLRTSKIDRITNLKWLETYTVIVQLRQKFD